MSFIRHRDGAPVAREAPRRVTWTESQAHARRNALWLRGVEEGFYDPTCRCVRPHSPGEIARLWGLTPRAVRAGLDAARRGRDLVREARDAH